MRALSWRISQMHRRVVDTRGSAGADAVIKLATWLAPLHEKRH